MADCQKSPGTRTVTVDEIPETETIIVDSNNKEVEIQLPNVPVTPEDNIVESNEDAITQPEVEDNKRKSDEMDVTPEEEEIQKKLKLDSPTPEEKLDDSVKESGATEIAEASNADILDKESSKVESEAKNSEIEPDPPKINADMMNPKGEAEVAA